MQKRKLGFSLAEMLMVLLVVSIVAGVSLPMMTKKGNVSKTGTPCQRAANGSDFFCAPGSNQSAIMGSDRTNIPNDNRSRFIINIPNDWPINTRSHIVFQKGTDTVGRLVFGDDSIGLGNGALRRTDPGVRNVAIGFDAMSGTATPTPDATAPLGNAGSGNVAIGSRALRDNNSGQHNVAIGSQALMSSTSGSRNVALGHNACMHNTSNSNIVCLGKDTVVTGDNGVAIGNGASAAENQIVIGSGGNQIVIDNDANSILIGGSTGSTGRKVTINGNLEVNGTITTTGANDIISGTTNSVSLRNHTHGITGRTTSNGACSHDHGFNITTTSINSDIRLKNMKDNNNDGLDKIRKLIVWNYSYKSDKENTPHVGVVAQELMKVFPNAVKKGADGYYLIRTEDIQYAMLNAIKELDKTIQKMSQRIKLISDKITTITNTEQKAQKRIQALEAKNKELIEKNNALIAQSKAFEVRLKKLEQR